MYRDYKWTGYRAGMNPKFLARVREKRKLDAAQKRMIKLAERRAAAEESARSSADAAKRTKAALVERLNSGPSQVEEIISIVAAIHGFTYEDIVGRRRFFALVHARHEAMRKVKEMNPHLSSVQIGIYFKRDHTTVLHAFWKRSGRFPKVGVRVSAWNKEDENSPNKKRRGVEAL